MPTFPRKPGDAVLSKDGTVKLDGRKVGVWRKDDIRLYYFSERAGEEPVVVCCFRHDFVTAIADYFNA